MAGRSIGWHNAVQRSHWQNVEPSEGTIRISRSLTSRLPLQ